MYRLIVILLATATLGAASPDSANNARSTVSVASVAVGYTHACVVLDNGDVNCWGSRILNGQATDSLVAKKVSGLPPVQKISAGRRVTCAIDTSQKVWCWGMDKLQREPGLSLTEYLSSSPHEILGLPPVKEIAAGFGHVCTLAIDGDVWCWGNNPVGELGDTTKVDRLTPVRVLGLPTRAHAIAVGVNNTCAAVQGGFVHCWGTDDQRQRQPGRRYGFIFDSTAPRLLIGVAQIWKIAMGRNFGCGLDANAKITCWGSNIFKQLGGSTLIEYPDSPNTLGMVAFDMKTRMVDIGAGMFTGCAVIEDGSISCWGKPLGQEGTDSPKRVAGITTATAVAVGPEFACAILRDRRVVCWGDNKSGQLGNGTRITSDTPVEVVGIAK